MLQLILVLGIHSRLRDVIRLYCDSKTNQATLAKIIMSHLVFHFQNLSNR